MAELASMMNIGREMAKKLDSIGIGSAEGLIRSGAEQAFLKLKERYPNVCLVHLYALEGAVCNVEFNSLPESRKKELEARRLRLRRYLHRYAGDGFRENRSVPDIQWRIKREKGRGVRLR